MSDTERTLALAVLSQAIADACLPWRAKGSKQPAKWGDAITNKDIAEACAFWADEQSEWGEARRIWCDAAGVEPTWARRKALAKIAISRGGCITRFASWRVHLQAARDARRKQADGVFAAVVAGESFVEIAARLKIAKGEIKRLAEVGRARAKRGTSTSVSRPAGAESAA